MTHFTQTEMFVYPDDSLDDAMERIRLVSQGMDMVSCRAREEGGWVLVFVERST